MFDETLNIAAYLPVAASSEAENPPEFDPPSGPHLSRSSIAFLPNCSTELQKAVYWL